MLSVLLGREQKFLGSTCPDSLANLGRNRSADSIRWLWPGAVSRREKRLQTMGYVKFQGHEGPSRGRLPNDRQPSFTRPNSPDERRSGAGAALGRAVGTVGINVERTRGPLHH